MNLSPLEGSARDRIHQAISGVKGTLTAGVDDISFMASSAGRSAEVSTRNSSISGSGRAHQQLLALSLAQLQLLVLVLALC